MFNHYTSTFFILCSYYILISCLHVHKHKWEDLHLNETCLNHNLKKTFRMNCNLYYHCVDGYLWLKQCESFDLFFDETTQTCLGTNHLCTYLKADLWQDIKP